MVICDMMKKKAIKKKTPRKKQYWNERAARGNSKNERSDSCFVIACSREQCSFQSTEGIKYDGLILNINSPYFEFHFAVNHHIEKWSCHKQNQVEGSWWLRYCDWDQQMDAIFSIDLLLGFIMNIFHVMFFAWFRYTACKDTFLHFSLDYGNLYSLHWTNIPTQNQINWTVSTSRCVRAIIGSRIKCTIMDKSTWIMKL